MPTSRPRCEVRRSSSSLTCRVGDRAASASRRVGRVASRRTSSSVSRTLSPRSTTSRASRSALGAPEQGAGMAGREAAVLDQQPGPPPAAPAAGSCWRRGCGSCRPPPRAPPGCGRTRRSAGGSACASSSGDRSARCTILDQRELERLLVRQLADHGRHLVQARHAVPPASAARRRRSRSPRHRWPPAGPEAAAGCRARGSIRPAPPARPRRSGGAAAEATGGGTRSARSGTATAPALARRRPRRLRRAGPTGPCPARDGARRLARRRSRRHQPPLAPQHLAREMRVGLRARRCLKS